MSKILINAVDPEECRIAKVSDNRLEEFHIETAAREITHGNIYKGVVNHVEPSLQAVFVDYGAERHGFLQKHEIHSDYLLDDPSGGQSLKDTVKRGQEMIVQVTKDPFMEKGAMLTTFISLPGRHTVLMPGSKTIGVSRKIDDEAERKRLKELRRTDLDVEAARNRYRTFKEITYESLTSLRRIFHYHFINAQQSIEEVQQSIVEELKYQSSLELDQLTNDLISRIPVASDIMVHARQDLVERLEQYTMKNLDLFDRVVTLIEQKFMPIVLRHAIPGRAYINSEDETFDSSLALAMAIDVFSERGFHAAVDIRQEEVPDRIDLQSGHIHTRRKRVYRFSIHFQGSVIRRG